MAIRSNGTPPPPSRPPASQPQRPLAKPGRPGAEAKGAVRGSKPGAGRADRAKLDQAAFRDAIERTDRDRQRTTTGTFVAVGEKGSSLDGAAAKARKPSGELRRAEHADGRVGKAPKADAKSGPKAREAAPSDGKVSAKGGEPTKAPKGAGDGKPPTHGDAKPVVKGDAKPAVKGDTKPAVKGDAKPAVKGDAKPAVKGDAKPAVKGDGKTDAKPAVKGDAKPAVKGDAKGAAEPAAKVDAKADGKGEAKGADGAKPAGDAAKAKPEAAAEKAAAPSDKAGVDASPDGMPNAAAQAAAARAGAAAVPQKQTAGATSSSDAKGASSSSAAKGEGASAASSSGAAGAKGAATSAGKAHGAKVDGSQAKRQVEGAIVSDRPQAGKAAPDGAAKSGGIVRSANAPAPLTTDAKLVALTGGMAKADVADVAKGLVGGALDGDLAAAAAAQRESDIADALSAGTEVAHASRRASADGEAFGDVASRVREDAADIDGVLLDDDARAAAASKGVPFVKKSDKSGVDFPVITTDMKLMATILAGQRMDAADIVSDLEMAMSESDADGGGDDGGGDEGGEE